MYFKQIEKSELNMKSVAGSIFIILFSEIISLIGFVLISGIGEQSQPAWIFSSIILVGILVYVWIFISNYSIKQVLIIGIFVPLFFILFFWFISFVWFKGLAKDVTILSGLQIDATLYLLLILIPAHLITLLVFRLLRILNGRIKK